ncbi:MAG: DegT/DnrJ/EryC1/StrS family aminotransferase [Bryobacteraceae bacterium]|jgi:dTDP-4-amino-4,6-dideoxygalactose transaminase
MPLPSAIHELEFSHGSVYGPEEAAAVADVLAASAPSCGPRVKAFERAFADYCGAAYGLAVTSATAGLDIAMAAAQVGPGDEVITTPISWISTANAAAKLGAKVVFADVQPDTLNLDPESVARKITPRTKVILPVHLYGQCCDMDALAAVARPRNILLIDDCAHAAGASYKGRKAGSLADISVFSFHQQKNMVTLGEGGMITTSHPALFERMLGLRSLCCRSYDPKGKYLAFDEQREPMGKRYWHLDFESLGGNSRMTEIQAAVGMAQLRKLNSLNRLRAEIASTYCRRLARLRGLRSLAVSPDVEHVHHIYCVLVEDDFPLDKEEFMWRLYTQYRIKTWSHYMPIHLTSVYRKLGHGPGECTVAESMFQRYVSLPIHPRLTAEAIDYLFCSIEALAS